jgi:hypothetical protein
MLKTNDLVVLFRKIAATCCDGPHLKRTEESWCELPAHNPVATSFITFCWFPASSLWRLDFPAACFCVMYRFFTSCKTCSRSRSFADIHSPCPDFAMRHQSVLEHEREHAAINAGISSTAFVAKTGPIFADGGAISGPVVGAVEALANIAHKLYLLGMEYRASRDLNNLLQDPNNLDITVFENVPPDGLLLAELCDAEVTSFRSTASRSRVGWNT